jgi:hypothetical protein
MREEMSGKEFKEFVEFLRTRNVEDNEYLKDKTTLEKIEALYKVFVYEKKTKEFLSRVLSQKGGSNEQTKV